MIKNGRFFAAPQKSEDNFKRVFARLAAAGAGRPVDKDGFADGPWTPESLAEAISAIDGNRDGVELRSVQVWFQDNDNGISDTNLRWLARIFGCGDPEATSEWQTELKAAKERLASERRAKRQSKPSAKIENPSVVSAVYDVALRELGSSSGSSKPKDVIHDDDKPIMRGMSLALRSEGVFSGPNSLLMPIVIWGGLGILWFVTISLGVHSVTYSPSEGINKQVGFIWSPGWNIGEPIFLPIYLILCTSLVTDWKQTNRHNLLTSGGISGVDRWYSKITRFTSSFWAILFICVVLIFIVQWLGVYFLPLREGSADVPMIDWMLIALVRPEVLSTDQAVFVSFLGFVYSGIIYWFLFTGSLFLYIVSGDFADIGSAKDGRQTPHYNGQVFKAGMKIMEVVFRCTIFGIMVALSIKLNAAYLVSDAETITGWLWHDASLLFGYRLDGWSWINGSPSPFFTSFLLLFLLCFVFGACLAQIKAGFQKTNLFDQEASYAQRAWYRMYIVLGMLSAGYLLIGQFYGFSVILALSIVVALSSLLWSVEPVSKIPKGKDQP